MNKVVNDTSGTGHGTHVVGRIVAHNPARNMFGIAYEAKVLAIKGLYYEGDYWHKGKGGEKIAEAIKYAVDSKARIINLSLSSVTDDPAVVDALQYAAEHEVLVFAAAGNEGAGSPKFPASHPLAVGVGNADSQFSQFALSSNQAGRERKDFFTAPGQFVLSTTPDNTYQTMSGTSMATPYVAGVAARMLSANPNLTKDQVLDILASTASHLSLPMLSSGEYLQGFATMLGLIALSTLLAKKTVTLLAQPTGPPQKGKRLGE